MRPFTQHTQTTSLTMWICTLNQIDFVTDGQRAIPLVVARQNMIREHAPTFRILTSAPFLHPPPPLYHTFLPIPTSPSSTTPATTTSIMTTVAVPMVPLHQRY
ncbi:hypothetical protein P691DRAFT_356820 [Macrolepiota fuliginosa MF-IS2]|uniref:Uncharacterized protein n=1 Tax=Macrolepiota fuliginosa MF-IS2 TaxID=1400762 RepID=A0A9P6C038_9AGAR|nr:hypothetical protein P691DRAFT_356820 [Macrolepiota fuliginosa MF-IS2]